MSVVIHPNTFVSTECTLRGKVTFGEGCVVHSQAVIDAGSGEIVFGKYNIVEECVEIVNRVDGRKMVIGDENSFLVKSKCCARSVGNRNYIGELSDVREDVTVGNSCYINPLSIISNDLPNQTCVFNISQRRRVDYQPPSTTAQAICLMEKFRKFGKALRNKTDIHLKTQQQQ